MYIKNVKIDWLISTWSCIFIDLLQAVRDIQFSHFKKSLLGAVSDDSALNLWDSNTRKLFTSFASDHKAPATGLSFSPMNDMLLCSVGLDKRIVFYDVQGKK